MSRPKILFNYFFLLWLCILCLCVFEKVKYISLERPVILYKNEKYVPYLNATARRYVRGDPHYYYSAYGETLLALDNNVTVDFYFYEFSSNTYRKTFFELHFRLCDLLNKDKFLGAFFSHGTFNRCPLPPGTYNVVNSTIPTENVPSLFVFKKGRILLNATYRYEEPLVTGYIDIEIKEKHVTAKIKN